MKILHVNYSDIIGGAAIATYQLHKNLLSKNITSKMLVNNKNLDDVDIIGPSNKFDIYLNNLRMRGSRFIKNKVFKTQNKESFSFNIINTNILKRINEFSSDIVHLHWIGNEMISVSQLKKIKKPIVWSFHDMWPINGGEHYSDDQRCKENYIDDNKPVNDGFFDINKFLWTKKLKNFNFEMNIICYSDWMLKLVQQSNLFKKAKINKVPYGIDLNFWKSIDKESSKKYFKINKDNKIILFGSTSGTNNRKGFKFLAKALNLLNDNKLTLLIAGNKPKKLEILDCDYIYLDKVDNIEDRRKLFAAVDLTVMPSLIENFGLFALESSACGIPCVIFENTGTSDLIIHKKNGYVAKNQDVNDLANGIKWCLEDENYKKICKEIKSKIKAFDQDKTTDEIINLYKRVIKS